jgi:anti-sigma regulatory factor (Ser/Thr protein kinase)
MRAADGRGGQAVKESGVLLHLEVLSEARFLCVVRGAIEPLADIAGFSPPDCRAVTRAVDEAMANIIRHAYGNRPGEWIQVTCRLLESKVKGQRLKSLEIVMWDRGVRFDPESVKERSLDEVKPGGLGLHFIRDSMDIMDHRRFGTKNRLRLVKYLKPEEPKQVCGGE